MRSLLVALVLLASVSVSADIFLDLEDGPLNTEFRPTYPLPEECPGALDAMDPMYYARSADWKDFYSMHFREALEPFKLPRQADPHPFIGLTQVLYTYQYSRYAVNALLKWVTSYQPDSKSRADAERFSRLVLTVMNEMPVVFGSVKTNLPDGSVIDVYLSFFRMIVAIVQLYPNPAEPVYDHWRSVLEGFTFDVQRNAAREWGNPIAAVVVDLMKNRFDLYGFQSEKRKGQVGQVASSGRINTSPPRD